MDPSCVKLEDIVFFPNACDVCKSTKNVSRCSGCKLISYCGEDHQLQHWPVHKSLCRAVSEILEREGLSHMFEDFITNFTDWLDKKERIKRELQIKLKRFLTPKENAMLTYPLVCITCGETKKDNLRSCRQCGVSTYCSSHSNDSFHEERCLFYKAMRELQEYQFKFNINMDLLQQHIQSVGEKTKILSSEDLPSSIVDFYDRYTQIESTISKDELRFLSRFFRIPLTLSTVVGLIYDTAPSQLIIHVDIRNDVSAVLLSSYWECLLHFLPDVKILKIVFIESIEKFNSDILLCEKCRSRKRRLSVVANETIYTEFILQKDYKKPNIAAFLCNEDPGNAHHKKIYENRVKMWSELKCPVALMIETESGFNICMETLETSSVEFQIIYEGPNIYGALDSPRRADDDSLLRKREYMIIFQPQRSKSLLKPRNKDSNQKDVEDRVLPINKKKKYEARSDFISEL